MIKGLPQLFVKRNGGVITKYIYLLDDDFEQKERTLKKRIRKLCLNLKEKNIPVRSLKEKSMRVQIISLSEYGDDLWNISDPLKDCSHGVPSFKFIRWIDHKSKTDPDYFLCKKER